MNSPAGRVAFTLICLAWVYAGFRLWPVANPPAGADVAAFDVFGEAGDANIVGVQPYLSPLDYRSAEALHAKLASYFDAAKARGWITKNSVVVFPEHAGTWLVAANAPAAVYAAPSTGSAMALLIAAEPVAFVKAYAVSREKDRAAAAVFRMRGASLAADYQTVFGALAREYGAVVVAGSVVLEAPVVVSGRIETRRGALYNTSAVFLPDGSPAADLVLKAHPIPSEASFTKATDASALPVFETPAGRLGVLICADSWHPDLYAELLRRNAEIIAVPAFLQPDGVWEEPWGGYVTGWPDDVAQEAAGSITEGDAWLAYSMPGRIQPAKAKAGMTAFLRGPLWDLGSDGRTLAYRNGELHQGSRVDGAALSVLWLDD